MKGYEKDNRTLDWNVDFGDQGHVLVRDGLYFNPAGR